MVNTRKNASKDTRYKTLFDNVTNAIAIYRAVDDGNDFVFEDFNLAAESMEGVKKQDLLGKSVLEVFPGVRDMGLFDVFQRVWKSGKPEQHPISHYEDDKLAGWRENYVFVLPSGELVASYTDETARKQAELDLKESEKKFHLIADFTFDWETWYDNDGALKYVSPACERITGYSPAEFMNDPKLMERIVHPEDRGLFLDHVETETGSHGPPANLQFRILTKDGDVRMVDHSCQAVVSKEGTTMGRRGSNRDNTELFHRNEIIAKQAREIMEMSVPLIQVWEGIIAVPLIGNLDSQRTSLLMERMLKKIVETKSPICLIDITGVPSVDTQTAQYLIEAVTAARLLGTKVILTGLSPPIAQTIVQLGIDFNEFQTCSTLYAGFQIGLKLLK